MSKITVDIEAHLRDCPPWDEPIDEALLPAIAQKIAQDFDSTAIYDQIDRLGCEGLRQCAAMLSFQDSQ